MKKQETVFGIHAVKSILQKNPERIVKLYVLKERHDKQMQNILLLVEKNNLAVELLSRKDLDQLVADANHQGVVAVCQSAKKYLEHDLEKILQKLHEPAFLLILDHVQDPHNLGACLRTADAAGVHAVIAPKDRSVSITPTVTKVACGAAETVPFIQVTNLARTLRLLKKNNIWVYGTSDHAQKNIYQIDLTGSIALVLGAEGKGLRRLTLELCDDVLNIPMAGFVSSLNVSVAAGVCLFEAVRQRMDISS